MIQIVGIGIDEFWQEMRKIIREETSVQPGTDKHPVDYSVKEARTALAERGKPPIDYKTFRKHLRLNGIQPYRKVGRTKYYLHSDLFKSQTFK